MRTTGYLTAEMVRAIYDATDVNTIFTTSSVGRKVNHKSWVVLEVFNAFQKLNIMAKNGWNQKTKSDWWVRTRPYLEMDDEIVLMGVTLGFDDFDRLSLFCQMPEMVLEHLIAELVRDNRLCAYQHGNRDYKNYSVIPPLLALFPQKVPTNLIKRTVYIEGKEKFTEHYNRNLPLHFENEVSA